MTPDKTDVTETETPVTPHAPGLPQAISTLPLTLSVRIGQVRMSVRDLTALGVGSLVALDARADAPLEICIEDRVVALGELTETEDGTLAVKLTETTA